MPIMLQRMLKFDPDSLSSLQCIITGGALLSPALREEPPAARAESIQYVWHFGSRFLHHGAAGSIGRKPESIGKPIQGVRAKIVSDNDQPRTERSAASAFAAPGPPARRVGSRQAILPIEIPMETYFSVAESMT